MAIPNPFKRFVKRCLQYAAARFGRHMRNNNEPELLILMYHRVLPADDERALVEEPGMMVTPEILRLHLSIIKKYFEVIRLSEWTKLKENNCALPQRACAITFDDGWADNYEFAFPILSEMNIPATIFLTSDMIGTDQQFWPERLAHVVTEIAHNHSSHWSHNCLDWIKSARTSYQFTDLPPSQEELAELINAAKELADQDIHRRLDRIAYELKLPPTGTEPSLLKWQQISEMIESGLIDVGSHTCHHIRLLVRTPITLMKDEIITSKQQIERQTGQPVTTFCYPNGDYSDKALELVRLHYKCAITTKTGWNTIDTDNHLLRRVGIHQGNANDKTAFLARISGWM